MKTSIVLLWMISLLTSSSILLSGLPLSVTLILVVSIIVSALYKMRQQGKVTLGKIDLSAAVVTRYLCFVRLQDKDDYFPISRLDFSKEDFRRLKLGVVFQKNSEMF